MRWEHGNRFGSEEEAARLSEVEEKLYHILVPEFDANRIGLDEFLDHYDEETVREDQKRVELKKRDIETQARGDPLHERSMRRGKLFEAIIADQANQRELFGKGTSLIVASEYDDYFHGIDAILQAEDETSKSYLALAADVTRDVPSLDEKLYRVKSAIDRGKLGNAKYVNTPDFRGELKNLPRVVIGADPKTIESVSALVLDFRTFRSGIRKNRENPELVKKLRQKFDETSEGLDRHPIRPMLREEICIQLEAFRDYAERQHRPEMARAYNRMLTLMRHTEAKQPVRSEEFRNDEVFETIVNRLHHLGL